MPTAERTFNRFLSELLELSDDLFLAFFVGREAAAYEDCSAAVLFACSSSGASFAKISFGRGFSLRLAPENVSAVNLKAAPG